ncbi:MAG: hypothetical protein ACE5I3_05320 [Phycisphaerae bacterium]
MRPPRALFVCRGSTSVGLGHVMRCRTVAATMARRTEVHVVLIGEERIGRALLDGHVPYTVLSDDVASLDVCRRVCPDVVVFDLLSFDERTFRAIAEQCRTVCISPIFDLLDQVDLAFSRAASPQHTELAGRGRPLLRAGARYATTAPHCRRISTSTYQRQLALNPLAVGICMGGADAANNTLRILEAVRRVPAGMLFWVLLGEGYVHSYQRLIDCVNADRRHEVILAKTRDSMWRILGGCAVVILAGGITNYEAAYAGIPAIITLADDGERWLLQDLIDAEVCRYVGAPLEAALPGIRETLTCLNRQRDELLAMHRRCKRLLDGRGAQRIVDEVLAFCGSGR